MATQLRDQICRQIFALPPDAPKARVHQALDPLLEIDFSDTEDDIHRIFHEFEADDGKSKDDDSTSESTSSSSSTSLDVTPIMVACDQGNVVCLDYILEKFAATEKTKEHSRLKRAKRNKLKTLLGNPLVDVSTTNRNSAMHHAAMIGCTKAIRILRRIQTYLMIDENHCQDQEKENQDETDVNRSSSFQLPATPIFLLLASARNNHNDTPIMMATQSILALEFVETWYHFALKEQQELMSANQVEAELALRKLLHAKNDSGDSCLSLACSHGRLELVKFMMGDDDDDECDEEQSGEMQQTSHCKVDVTADELDRCKASFQRMEQALNSSRELKKQYQNQRDNVEACLKIMEARLQVISERATRELLEQEDSTELNKSPKPKSKKKKKAKKPKGNAVSTNASLELPNETTTNESEKDEGKSNVVLKTLPDGTMAVQVQGKPEDLVEGNALVGGINANMPALDASEMLRERFKGISNEEVDSVMSALCLDVKCLLYSDHGMALNLSAAQLDAVQQILEKQLESVKKARDIQQRVHETSAGQDSKKPES